MPNELLREIRKLETRLKNFVEREEISVKELRKCLDKLIILNGAFEQFKKKTGSKIGELINLRLEAIKIFSSSLKKMMEAEHEKNHLLESYGTLILTLEREFMSLHQY